MLASWNICYSESYKVGRKRVISAVDLIIAKAFENKDVAICGHGISNRLIARVEATWLDCKMCE